MKKRKNYTKDFKAWVVLDSIKGRKTINELNTESIAIKSAGGNE